jgi:predicted ATPase
MADSVGSNSEGRAYVRRVTIRNYKSIGKCAVTLGHFTVLVGRNGSGKSNFLDALRFVTDGLQTSLDHAVKSRGGIDAVRRLSTGHPRNFAVRLEIDLPDSHTAMYGFEVAARKGGGFIVKDERLRVLKSRGEVHAQYAVEEGTVIAPSNGTLPPRSPDLLCHLEANNAEANRIRVLPPATSDRLYLVTVSGLPEFRPVYDVLVSMGFYNLSPEAMKELQSPDAGELLHRDGSNIASVIARLGRDQPDLKDRIKEYLSKIVPGIVDVDRVPLGPRETLEFRQKVEGSESPWRFYAASMSDGTLRALGALVAVTQLASPTSPVSLVGIEEPEAALHPAAAGALMDALREAASRTQIVVTTHSPDLLEQVNHETEDLLAVQSREGNTEIGPVEPASRRAMKDHLYSAGELLRMDQLAPDPQNIAAQRQMKLFDVEDES